MTEIGTRRKRTVQEPMWEPSRESVRRKQPVPKEKPKRKQRAPA